MVWIPKPVLELKMEGNANDSSGYDNHGTVTDATLTTDKWGHPNSAYSFNGTSAEINCGDDNSLNIVEPVSIFIIFKPDNITGVHRLFGRKDGNDGFSCGMVDSKLRFTSHGVKDYDTVNDYMNTTQYFFVLYVLDSDYDMSFYVNGDFKEKVLHSSGIILSNGSAYVGSVSGAERYSGIISSVLIYNVALTPTQVSYLYDKTKRNYGGLP